MKTTADFKARVDQLIGDIVSSGVGSGDKITEVRARLFATGIFETFAQWYVAESEGDGDGPSIVSSAVNLAIGMVALPLTHPQLIGSQPEVAKIITQEFQGELFKLVEKMQARIKAARGARQ